MAIASIDALAYAAAPQAFDAVIDVRSPAEFAEDRLPAARNWPVLDDAERARVGTLYVQDSPLAARKLGAVLVARNIATHLERELHDQPRDWRVLVYCWRGGQRSGSMAWMLDQIGFRATRLAGGYKAFRAVVRAQLETLPEPLHFKVLAGRTGSGKTRLLAALAAQGAQVLDLEALAVHRGSVLGAVPGQAQPSQKGFDTVLWSALRALDPARPVFVESESKKIGQLQLPDALVRRMREQGQVLRIEMAEPARIELLLQEYRHFFDEPARFAALLGALVELRGRERVQRWQGMAGDGQWPALFAELMREHYDPLYDRSIASHYPGLEQALPCTLADGEPATLEAAARRLLA